MQLPPGRLPAVAIFAVAAILEVAGDAFIRKGMRGGGFAFLGLGVALLGSYGILVNLSDSDFSKVLGGYVGIFAIASVVIGHLAFGDQVPASTWLGLAIILCGSLIIHLGLGR